MSNPPTSPVKKGTENHEPRLSALDTSTPPLPVNWNQPPTNTVIMSSSTTYNQALSSALGADRDIIRNRAIGAIELLTFFPHHTQWFEVLKRFARHGWTTEEIARGQLHARGQLSAANIATREAALRHQMSSGGKSHYQNQSWTKTNWENASHPDSLPFTAPANGQFLDLYEIPAGWGLNRGANGQPRNLVAERPTLASCVNGVRVWPRGQDAGLVTQALQWANSQGQAYLNSHTIDDIPAILAAHPGWAYPTDATQRYSWDARAKVRMNEDVPRP